MKKKGLEVDRAIMADLLGVQPDSVTRLVSLGMPVLRTGGGRGRRTMYDAVRALAWTRERQQAEGPANGSVRDQYLSALRDRVLQDTQTRAGELVAIEEVVLAGQMIVKGWTAKIRALPQQMVQTGVIPPEKVQPVAELLRQLLVEISTRNPSDEFQKRRATRAQKKARKQ